jgi:hypothetical protein
MTVGENTSSELLLLNSNKRLNFLLDKYLKSNFNYMPLNAYLKYIENKSIKPFESIASIQTNDNHRLKSKKTANHLAADSSSPNLISSLNIIKNKKIHPNDNDDNDLILVHKLYKIVITIDYSQQLSNLTLIRKALEKIFSKLENEYDGFIDLVSSSIEPEIDLTVLLSNPLYKPEHYLSNLDATMSGASFIILVYSKRFTKSNAHSVFDEILNQINESKSEMQKSPLSNSLKTENIKSAEQRQQQISQTSKKILSSSSFDHLIHFVFKLFNNFTVDTYEFINIPMRHHIHITDGIFYTNDLLRVLDRISKSSITFSYICTGNNNNQLGSNVFSSFGYLSDHFLMKQISEISNGFYATIDDNLEYQTIVPQSLFYLCKIKMDFENSVSQVNKNDEIKLLQKYEINSNNNNNNNNNNSSNGAPSLFQLIRFRSMEGFFLESIQKPANNDNNNNNNKPRFVLTFKKYFTQTIYFVYKLSLLLNNNNQQNTSTNNKRISVEIFVSSNFSNVKYIKSQTIRDQMVLFFQQINKLDQDRTFKIGNLILRDPPEILIKFKEPLFKLTHSNSYNTNTNNYINVNNNNNNSNSMSSAAAVQFALSEKFMMQNMHYTLNLCLKMQSEFINFANAWFNLSFFRYEKNYLNKFFYTFYLKLILDYDQPLPSINSNIFDIYNTTTNSSSYMHNSGIDGGGGAGHYHRHNNPHHHHSSSSLIFKCQNSMNKLYAMIIEWCDIVLVENSVYLKFLTVNTKQQQSSNDLAKNQSTENNNNKNFTIDISELTMNEIIKNDNPSSDYGIEQEEREEETTNKNQKQQFQSSASSYKQNNGHNSFLIIRIDSNYVPYVSIQFLFHSNSPYLECIRLLNSFEDKIRQLNHKSYSTSSSSSSSNATSSSTNVGSLANTMFKASMSLPYAKSNLDQTHKNVDVDENNISFTNNNNNNTNSTNMSSSTLSNSNSPSTKTLATTTTTTTTNSNNNANLSDNNNECCHLLKKNELFEMVKNWIFPHNKYESSEGIFNRGNSFYQKKTSTFIYEICFKIW